MKEHNIFIEHSSGFDLLTTVEKIITTAAAKSWQNPAVHNLQQSLAKAGKTVRPVQIIEICKPEFSAKILEKNDERIASVMMPCRIAVYEKDDGKTYVSLLNMEAMAPGLPQAITESVGNATIESHEIVKTALGL
ncbi:MAG TPA: DUF302 domain-containing protein [Bacteroidales bacterium]|nr:DUF302 domain-containing protein [Bacteroidales bacterium]HOH84222.1 DUF302 domain-containing protein [Bacteroidales bacterium]